MLNSFKSFTSLGLFIALYFSIAAVSAAAATPFVNPVLKTPGAYCAADNLRNESFSSEVSLTERVKVCQAIDKITAKLNSVGWSPELSAELRDIWRVFSAEAVTLRLMPKNSPSRMLAMAEAFPSGMVRGNFEACVYLRPNESDDSSFFQVLMHELRHVYDFHQTWKNRETVDSVEIERRAFLLMGKLAQETSENASGVPKFWKKSWRNLSAQQISYKRAEAVDKYLRDNKFYRELAADGSKNALDFSYLKNTAANSKSAPVNSADWRTATVGYDKKDAGRLPNRPLPPKTNYVLPQNVRELGFNLEKPKNSADEREILRVALANEKKLYYGMQNFVYEQKLAFQCWQKGKVSASVSENNTVTRSAHGNAQLKPASVYANSSAAAVSPCTLDSRNLQTDFAETFWASPALEKMPIVFAGFAEVDGQTLARYTVLQPDARLFKQLSNEYGTTQPFRVFVGTIFVSPKDGQIVRFWGTSFPEDAVTGSRSQKVWGSYSVTALRQKLNIDRGLWVTVYIGTVAVANVKGNSRPFSYTVNFENYRQSTTDVRIFDDEAVSHVGSGGTLVGSR